MTAEMIRQKYKCNVMKVGFGSRAKWVAFWGGNGTGKPIIDIAEAYTLQTLAVRVEQKIRKG